MFKGRDVIGKPVIAYDDGKKFAEVKDLIFDQDSHQLLGLLLRGAGRFRPAEVLLFRDVQALSIDAVITSSRGAISQVSQQPAVSDMLDHRAMLKGACMLTTDGRDLGMIIDLYFSETSGQVDGYEVSGGMFADAYSGCFLVPVLQTLKIGCDVAFVPTTTVQASSEIAPVTTERLQHLGRFAHETDEDIAKAARESRHGLGRPAIVSPTHAITDPAEQKNFVAGRTLERDVLTSRGSALAIRGQPITHEIADAAQALGLLDDLYRATGGCWSVPG